MVIRCAIGAALVMVAVSAAACADDGTGGANGGPLPSGSLGVVTPAAAADAVLGLCRLAGSTDAAEAEAVFLDRSHGTLHVIASAAEARDRASAAALLEAKQVVEADLARDELPASFRRDVERLLDATRAALDAIGLDAPACGG
jgi:hypothetical protein